MNVPTLEGFGLRLEPAADHHAIGLAEVAEPELFELFVLARPASLDEVGMVQLFADLRKIGAVPLVMVVEGKPVGVSCFLDIRPAHRGLEIGFTWIGTAYQGTFVNPASKRLMLAYVFEELNFERAQLKCDGRNARSRRAIEKLGAKPEGILRKHMILPDGYVRDTVMYSVVASEWPKVRDGLDARLRGLGRCM